MPTLKKICENTSNLNSLNSRPRARLLIRLTSTDLPSDQFSVFLLQKGVMMTNKPPQGLRAATTSSASSYSCLYPVSRYPLSGAKGQTPLPPSPSISLCKRSLLVRFSVEVRLASLNLILNKRRETDLYTESN